MIAGQTGLGSGKRGERGKAYTWREETERTGGEESVPSFLLVLLSRAGGKRSACEPSSSSLFIPIHDPRQRRWGARDREEEEQEAGEERDRRSGERDREGRSCEFSPGVNSGDVLTLCIFNVIPLLSSPDSDDEGTVVCRRRSGSPSPPRAASFHRMNREQQAAPVDLRTGGREKETSQ